MNRSFELNNIRKDDITVRDTQKLNRVVEICSAMFSGADLSIYGKEVDSVSVKLKDLGRRSEIGDVTARAELNTIVKFMVQPKLLESLKVFNALGNYKEIGYDEQPIVKTYNYENIDARMQAANSDVNFSSRNWIEYPIVTKTISSGMAIDYRELASGNFAGNMAEEVSQVQVDMNNKAVAYALGVLKKALKENTENVKFYGEFQTVPTQALVDDMVTKMRKLGKVNIAGDFSLLSTICDWNGYKTVGGAAIPFYSQGQVDEFNKSGLNGFYKGTSLVEIQNPYNFTKPLADKTAFETYHSPDELYFTTSGGVSPFNIFRRGGIATMTGNDVETGTVKTRFDLEIGADVVKGREFEIGLLAKAN